MPRSKVLIVEDDGATCRQLEWALKDEFEVLTAGDRATALVLTQKEAPALTLVDLGLPPRPDDPEEGLRFIQEARQEGGNGRVIVCTGHRERDYAVRAVSYGAVDVLTKPVDPDQLKFLMQRVCRVAELEQELVGGAPAEVEEEMIGTSDAIRQVFGLIRKIATTDVPVLIVGESGTGKELTAKALHERSARARGPFVTINCGAIPETLLEAELFGHERGAFTGAVQLRKGKVEYAQEGTLFLDEIGEMSLALQVKLLRFLQDRTIERVGGRQQIAVDARIVAATNIDLRKAIERGAFREDLYYRLGVVSIKLPPLRERGEDAIIMARVFLKRVNQQMRKRVRGFTREAITAIQGYGWPGNVRELLNKVRRGVALAEGPYVTPQDLDLPTQRAELAPTVPSLREARERLEAEMIVHSMVRHDGNLSQVAEELRISRPTLYALLRKYRIREKH